jgi:hypothetical protein
LSLHRLKGAEIHLLPTRSGHESRNAFEFAPFAPVDMLSPMNRSSQNSANPLIAKIHQLFSRDSALENDYLRQENKILRSKLGARVPLTESDRRIFVKYGLRIKDRLDEVISIAKPDTLLAWNRRQKQKKWTFQSAAAKAGRPRKPGDTEALIVRLAEENNSWGYKRISGELKKVGHRACPSYVRDVLRRHGLPPVPGRKGLSWKQFLQVFKGRCPPRFASSKGLHGLRPRDTGVTTTAYKH